MNLEVGPNAHQRSSTTNACPGFLGKIEKKYGLPTHFIFWGQPLPVQQKIKGRYSFDYSQCIQSLPTAEGLVTTLLAAGIGIRLILTLLWVSSKGQAQLGSRCHQAENQIWAVLWFYQRLEWGSSIT